ncbi:MAG: agmatine deiminase family protein, partial [Gammaproteobacteria bacterium]|nr:agmatine deiminase family protein [Gammaproteobacteria bacterium]
QLQQAFPEYEIIPVQCRSLIEQYGSLHCITMQML